MSALSGPVSRIRFRHSLKITKHLRNDPRTRLPQPHVPITVRDFAPCRYSDHYHNTLHDNMMYMTYVHEHGPRPAPRVIRPRFDPDDPYTQNRKNPPVGGSQLGKKPPPPDTPENVTRLEKVSLHIMEKSALANRQNLVGPIMVLRALSGETEHGGGRHNLRGVQLVRGKKTVGAWKIRPKIPVGVKVDLQGPAMYDFIGALVDFVLPRIRDFNGILLPAGSSNFHSPSAVSGVVSFGLPSAAMGFFPQIEVNVDSYPKMYGMHLHFVTNATGVGAQNRARALLSGFQIPFQRR